MGATGRSLILVAHYCPTLAVSGVYVIIRLEGQPAQWLASSAKRRAGGFRAIRAARLRGPPKVQIRPGLTRTLV